MVHYVSGLIGGADRLTEIASAHQLDAPVRLDSYGLAFLPLDDENLDGIAGVDFDAPTLEDFDHLSPSLMDWVKRCSGGCDLAYIETQYSGGTGGQGAVLYRDGALAFGPAFGDGGTINEALARMGVRETAGLDAFATVGLSNHRGNEAWRAAGRSR